jgi:hypothetical protein
MSDRLARLCVDTFLTLNSCAWPWVFGGAALWYGDWDRLWFWVSVGVVTGGAIFLFSAALRLILCSTESAWGRHVPSASKFTGAAVIMFLLGGAGIAATSLWPQPPIHRFRKAAAVTMSLA